jgi:hypothetical protein
MSLFRRMSSFAGSDPSEEEAMKRPRTPQLAAPRQPAALQARYTKVLSLVQERYGKAEPKTILHKLLGDDVNRDAAGTDELGRVGGETLACYLFSIKDHPSLASGIVVWLRSQLQKYESYPSTHACLLVAIDFVPQVEAAMRHHVVPQPSGFTEHINLALPVRVEGVGASAASRRDIRGMCMDALTASGSYMAKLEANAEAKEAPTFFEAKAPNSRGRQMSAGQMRGAARLVEAKITTGAMREAQSDSEDEEEVLAERDGEDEGTHSYDAFVRFSGRDLEQPALLGGSRPGFQYDVPKHGTELIGWNCKATFPTGPKGRMELRWHDGFVVDCRMHVSLHVPSGPAAAIPVHHYQLFFPIDSGDEWVRGDQLPHKSICFRKPNLEKTRVSSAEIADAKRKIAVRETHEGGAGSGAPRPTVLAAAIRNRADWHPRSETVAAAEGEAEGSDWGVAAGIMNWA